MAESLLKQALGPDPRVTEPESVFAFRDHLTFLGRVMSQKHRDMGLLERADGLAITQEDFTTKQGIRLYGENPEGGSEAICTMLLSRIWRCPVRLLSVPTRIPAWQACSVALRLAWALPIWQMRGSPKTFVL